MTIEEINNICKDSLVEYLEIEFIDYGDTFVIAKMPVNSKKRQPQGLLHGGASLALAETVASAGSFLLVDTEKYNVLGLQVTGNHISTVKDGDIFAKAEIVHLGQSTHVWDVKIYTVDDKLISVARVTNIIIEKN